MPRQHGSYMPRRHGSYMPRWHGSYMPRQHSSYGVLNSSYTFLGWICFYHGSLTSYYSYSSWVLPSFQQSIWQPAGVIEWATCMQFVRFLHIRQPILKTLKGCKREPDLLFTTLTLLSLVYLSKVWREMFIDVYTEKENNYLLLGTRS